MSTSNITDHDDDIPKRVSVAARRYTEVDMGEASTRLMSTVAGKSVRSIDHQSTAPEMNILLNDCKKTPDIVRGWVAVDGEEGTIVGSIFGHQWGASELETETEVEVYSSKLGFLCSLFVHGTVSAEETDWEVARVLLEAVKTVTDDKTWCGSVVAVPTAFSLPDKVWFEHGYTRMPDQGDTVFLGSNIKRDLWVYVGPRRLEQGQSNTQMAATQV